jgi:hypothetical protein
MFTEMIVTAALCLSMIDGSERDSSGPSGAKRELQDVLQHSL